MQRFFVYLKAKLRGSWWLPCPVCGEGFAAFEGSWTCGVNYTSDSYQRVCAKESCLAEARRQDREARGLPPLIETTERKS